MIADTDETEKSRSLMFFCANKPLSSSYGRGPAARGVGVSGPIQTERVIKARVVSANEKLLTANQSIPAH